MVGVFLGQKEKKPNHPVLLPEGTAGINLPLRSCSLLKSDLLFSRRQEEIMQDIMLPAIDWVFSPCPLDRGASFVVYKRCNLLQQLYMKEQERNKRIAGEAREHANENPSFAIAL